MTTINSFCAAKISSERNFSLERDRARPSAAVSSSMQPQASTCGSAFGTRRPYMSEVSPLSPVLVTIDIRMVGRLTRSLPLSRPDGLPVHAARVPAAPFCETPTDGSQTGVRRGERPAIGGKGIVKPLVAGIGRRDLVRVIRWIGELLVLLTAMIAIAWAFGAVWFDAPFGNANKVVAGLLPVASAIALVFFRPFWRKAGAVALLFGVFLVWWL